MIYLALYNLKIMLVLGNEEKSKKILNFKCMRGLKMSRSPNMCDMPVLLLMEQCNAGNECIS